MALFDILKPKPDPVIERDYYGQVAENNFIQAGELPKNYYSLRDGGFFKFSSAETPQRVWDDPGWKLRISVDEKDVAKAWNIVCQELIKDKNYHTAKVVTPEKASKFSNPEDVQYQKMITLYTDNQLSAEEYKSLMTRLEERFEKEGIKAGGKPHGEPRINGSNYFSYRNDMAPDGEYNAARNNIDEKTALGYNKSTQTDPYASFDMAQARGIKRIREADWLDVKSANSGDAKYVNIDRMAQSAQQELVSELKANGVEYQIKRSSMNGGMNVIAIQGEGLQKINQYFPPKTETPLTAKADAQKKAAEAKEADMKAEPLKQEQPTPATPPTPPPPLVNLKAAVDTLKDTPWLDVESSSSGKAKYADIGKLSQDQRMALESALKAHGIEYQIKHSSYKGGMEVIAIQGKDLDKMTGIISAGVKIVEAQKTLAETQWVDVESSKDGKAKYADVGKMTAQQRSALEESLKIQGIEYEVKRSSLNGGTDVIAVKGEGLKKLSEDVKEAAEYALKASKYVGELGKRGGVISGVVLGTAAAGLSLAGGAKPAEAAEVAIETAVPYAESGIKLAQGDVEAAKKAAVVETASNVGGFGGALAGAAIGQAVIPVPVVGAAVGAVVGGMGGGIGGGALAETLLEDDKKTPNAITTRKAAEEEQLKLLTTDDSPMPRKVRIHDQEMSMTEALRNHFDVVKDAMSRSPEAQNVIRKWKMLEDYKQQLPDDAPTPPMVAQAQTAAKLAAPA